jgi:hypothetical protein
MLPELRNNHLEFAQKNHLENIREVYIVQCIIVFPYQYNSVLKLINYH